jgi:prevent-host-death family protein
MSKGRGLVVDHDRSKRRRKDAWPIVAPFRHGASASFTATQAKSEFGHLLEKTIQGGIVIITKHDTPKAVLLSMDKFIALSDAYESKLNTLSAEFDSMLARMQGPSARNAMDAAFHAKPKELGRAAVNAARRRG